MSQFRKRTRLYDQQDGKCWLCGKPMDWWEGTGRPHETAATLDHVLPRSMGGSNRDDNVKLAHEICNRIRGNNHECRSLIGPMLEIS